MNTAMHRFVLVVELLAALAILHGNETRAAAEHDAVDYVIVVEPACAEGFLRIVGPKVLDAGSYGDSFTIYATDAQTNKAVLGRIYVCDDRRPTAANRLPIKEDRIGYDDKKALELKRAKLKSEIRNNAALYFRKVAAAQGQECPIDVLANLPGCGPPAERGRKTCFIVLTSGIDKTNLVDKDGVDLVTKTPIEDFKQVILDRLPEEKKPFYGGSRLWLVYKNGYDASKPMVLNDNDPTLRAYREFWKCYIAFVQPAGQSGVIRLNHFAVDLAEVKNRPAQSGPAARR